MARLPITIRRVDANTLGDFFGLWLAGRFEAGWTRDAAERYAGDGRITAALDSGRLTAYLAYIGGEPVGYAVTHDTSQLALVEAPALTVEQLYVAEGSRRRGVARQLLSAIATRAERSGIELIATNVPSRSREANRILAKFGFAPTVTRRTMATPALLLRLAGGNGRQPVDSIIARRRVARLRAAGRAHPAR